MQLNERRTLAIW